MVELFPGVYACKLGFGYNLIKDSLGWIVFNDEEMRDYIERRVFWWV